jgi:hypothetical protein
MGMWCGSWRARLASLGAGVLLFGCKSSDPAAGGETEGTGSETGVAGTETEGEPLPDLPWEPGRAYASPIEPNDRGFLDRRGIIHGHSVYSHDACDGEPRDAADNVDATCLEDLRRGMCQTRHDFHMLTDHGESFSRTEFPEVLLYDPARGDELVEVGGAPVASWAACEGARPLLIMAGCEASRVMPIGLESHVSDRDAYGNATPEAIEAFKAHGAIALLSHAEDWTVEQLVELPLDGFEMYNLHANTMLNLVGAAQLVTKALEEDPGLPHPDLSIMPIWSEDPRYIERWGSVLATGARRVTTMGTDAHQNTLPQLLPDGERIDSFRRLLLWFSNHVLVQPDPDGTWNHAHVKQAIAAGRLYGVFEYLGYAEGFDARVVHGGEVAEIGSDVSLGSDPVVVVDAPHVRGLDEASVKPEITIHLLRAIEGGFEEVAEGAEHLEYAPDLPGAYRVEIRITPLHLEPWLGDYAELAAEPRVWIYANPFYFDP